MAKKKKKDLIRHLDSPLEITAESNFSYSWQQEAKPLINLSVQITVLF